MTCAQVTLSEALTINVTVAFEPVRNSPRYMRAPEAAARYDVKGNKWPLERGERVGA